MKKIKTTLLALTMFAYAPGLTQEEMIRMKEMSVTLTLEHSRGANSFTLSFHYLFIDLNSSRNEENITREEKLMNQVAPLFLEYLNRFEPTVCNTITEYLSANARDIEKLKNINDKYNFTLNDRDSQEYQDAEVLFAQLFDAIN